MYTTQYNMEYTHILTTSSVFSLMGGSDRRGEKLQIQLFTDTQVGKAIPTENNNQFST